MIENPALGLVWVMVGLGEEVESIRTFGTQGFLQAVCANRAIAIRALATLTLIQTKGAHVPGR